MGQYHSATTSSIQSNSNNAHQDIPSLKRKKSIQQVKQKLARSELVALHQTFQQLKSVSSEHVDFIEAKQFLEHLHLPSTLEPAGILLFKSFSRLGAYPNCNLSSAGIHLSWNSFLTAFAVLTGKLDDSQHDTMVFETAFFDSLALLPRPSPPPPTAAISTAATEDEGAQQTVDDTLTTSPNRLDDLSNNKGYTLAELGIRFDDEDDNADVTGTGTTSTTTPQDTLKMLRTDLKELFILAIWIVHAEHAEQQNTKPNIDDIRNLADTLTNTIYALNDHYTAKNDNSNDDDCISHLAFCAWKSRNAPYLFKTIQSFIYTRFAMAMPKKPMETIGNEQQNDKDSDVGDDTASLRTVDLVLSQDVAPLPVVTDILDANGCTLLSWCLPPIYLATKHWTRLYSGTQDGFSMNRFENHVFKYPGPTLLMMQIQVTHSNKNGGDVGKYSSGGKGYGTMITFASIVSEPWKQSQHYWGTNHCFLAELSPGFELFKATGHNQQYIYYHSQVGIGFGGTTSHQPPTPQKQQTHPSVGQVISDGCILFLDNTLQTGRYHQEMYPALPTYEKSRQHDNSNSNSNFDYNFDIVNLEVFGLGNEKLTLAQKKAWDFEYQDANRRAGVQIRQQDGQIDKEILRLAGIIQGDDHYYDSNQPQQR